jgi:hypothetical protein
VRRLAIVLAALLLALAPCSIAVAQIGPQAPGPLLQEPPPPPPTVNQDATKNSGLSTLQLVLIFGSAMAVLAGIAWVILHDAHRAAPVEEPPPAAERKLTLQEHERQERKRRQKAKAARRQRKRNRPR